MKYKPTLKWFCSNQFWTFSSSIWALVYYIASVTWSCVFTLILCFHDVLCQGLRSQKSLPKNLTSLQVSKEFRGVWVQEILGESLLPFFQTRSGEELVKSVWIWFKRKKPNQTPQQQQKCFKYGRVYVGETSKQMKGPEESWCNVGETGKSGPPGNHYHRCLL